MPGPLTGLRVLDLSQAFAGPWASQLLGDLGAEVIKIERPRTGDDTRSWGPPVASKSKTDRMSGPFLSMNRSKASVTVDLSHPEGKQLILALAETADIVLENFRPGVLDRLGLGWDAIRAASSRAICCSISGFGRVGPYSGRAAYDFAIQATAGLMSVTGEDEARPGGGPQKVGVAVIDLVTGLYATIGILSALAARDRTGTGQVVDIAMLDVCVNLMSSQAMSYLLTGEVPRCTGNAHPKIIPQDVYHARDGRFVIVVGNDTQFRRLCEAIGLPDMASDARFATNAQRVLHRETMEQVLRDRFAQRTVAEWLATFGEAGIPSGPINDLAQVFADPCVQERGLQFAMPHPTCGTVPQIANPVRLSETPTAYDKAPPALGADTDSVLMRLLNLSTERLQSLRSAGAI